MGEIEEIGEDGGEITSLPSPSSSPSLPSPSSSPSPSSLKAKRLTTYDHTRWGAIALAKLDIIPLTQVSPKRNPAD